MASQRTRLGDVPAAQWAVRRRPVRGESARPERDMKIDRAGLPRQMSAFVAVGFVAGVAHYGVLIGLVEAGGFDPVPATLLGYGAGGIVSYGLNRRLTYASDRPHAQAGWRFAA